MIEHADNLHPAPHTSIDRDVSGHEPCNPLPPPQKGSSLAFVIEPVVQKSAVLQTSTVITAAILGTAVTLMTNYAINPCLQPGAYAVKP